MEQQRDYIIDGAAKVYRASGAELEHLLFVAMAQVFSGTLLLGSVPLHVFVVERFDPRYTGRFSQCPSVAEIEGFHNLQRPCVIFAAKAMLDAMKINWRGVGQPRITIDSDYVWLYALAPDLKLPPGQTSTIGLAFEAVSDGMSEPVHSDSASRVHISIDKLDPKDLSLLRDVGGSFTPSIERIIGLAPAPAMYSTFLRNSRSDKARGTGMANGPKAKGGEFQYQQAACTTAILDRFLPHVRAFFGPVLAWVANRKAGLVNVCVGSDVFDAVSATCGGWGNEPHFDSQDATQTAVIGQIAVGDTGNVRGGYFVLPGLNLKIAPGECSLQAVRTTMLQHFTCPHTASEEGRYVGVSFHSNKQFEHGLNPKKEDGSKKQDDLNFVRKLTEKNIEEDTKKNYPAIRELLQIQLENRGSV